MHAYESQQGAGSRAIQLRMYRDSHNQLADRFYILLLMVACQALQLAARRRLNASYRSDRGVNINKQQQVRCTFAAC